MFVPFLLILNIMIIHATLSLFLSRRSKVSPQGPEAIVTHAGPLPSTTHSPCISHHFTAHDFDGSTPAAKLEEKQQLPDTSVSSLSQEMLVTSSVSSLSQEMLVTSPTSLARTKPCSTVLERLNLRRTADRRSRASSSGHSSSATPTTTPTLSPKPPGRGNDGESSKSKEKAENFTETTGSKEYQQNGGTHVPGYKQRASPGSSFKNRRKTDSRLKNVVKPQHRSAEVEEDDDEGSAHHKVLKSWEADYYRGTKATRGAMLYALEKVPEKLESDGKFG